MSSENLHAPRERLTRATLSHHHAIVSLMEELDAADWYRQRAEDTEDAPLREILLHNMREEIEHACMLLEWLRRNDAEWSKEMDTYLYTEAAITEVEEAAEAGGRDREVAHSAGPSRPAGGVRRGPTGKFTVGSMKERGDLVMIYLNREHAPFGDDVWHMIDEAAVKAARDRLSARRFLDVDGPYGTGLTAIEVGNDGYCRQPGPDEAGAVIGRAISMPMLRKSFKLSIRRLAAYLELGQPLNLTPVEDAAEAVVAREEETIYFGQADFGLEGLLTAKGRKHLDGGNWANLEEVLNDVIAAVTKLDDVGFRGPYALVLSPALFNGLFRHYPGTNLLQLEHLRRLFGRGIHKASIEGGAVVDPHVGPLLVGQDLSAGYVSQDGIHYELYLSESIVLRLDEPQAVCTISPSQG